MNLKQGDEGNIARSGRRQSKGLVKPGEWNHFKITVVGDTAELEINGQQAWKAAGLENADGYIGLQSEVDGGGQFEFRNIELTDLDFHAAVQRPGPGRLDRRHQRLRGRGRHAGLAARPAAESCSPTSEYADFSFRFDFKLAAGGNNGVGIRAPLEGDPAYAGMEIQILDDSSPQLSHDPALAGARLDLWHRAGQDEAI